MINKVDTAEKWKRLLGYYIDCLGEENRLRYVIKPERVPRDCFFLPNLEGDFLRSDRPSYKIRSANPRNAQRLRRFVLGDPHSSSRPLVAFGYPFFVDSNRQLMPLLYVTISGTPTDKGVALTRQSVDTEVNFAAIWEVLPGDKELALDEVFAKFDTIETGEGEAHFDTTLALLISELEDVSGVPVQHIRGSEFDQRHFPRHTIVQCPVLFRVRSQYTNHLLRELDQLLNWRDWEEVQPALQQLLTHAGSAPYPSMPNLAEDPRLYVVPANDSQRRAVAAAGQHPLTVVTGPPGTGKSQLIVNIVGDAILKGESVLIASKNNRAVDVVYERFLSQIDYPGAVRTGKREHRRRLPRQLQQVFAPVRSGRFKGNLDEARKDYDVLLKQIDAQRKRIKEIQQLMQDRAAYQAEVRELAALLPERVGQASGSVQIHLPAEEHAKLAAALRNLSEEVDALVQERESLAAEMRNVLGDNSRGFNLHKHLQVLERKRGVSFDELRQGSGLDSFAEMDRYLLSWSSLVDGLRLEDQLAHLRERAVEAKQEAEETRHKLPGELAEEIATAASEFGSAREQQLRQHLDALQPRSEVVLETYEAIAEHLSSLVERFRAARHWISLLASESDTHDPQSPRFDMRTLNHLFGSHRGVLDAHESSRSYTILRRQLEDLRQEESAKRSEFDALLGDLKQRARAARTEVPATLITRVDGLSERGSPNDWEAIASRLSQLEDWCTRVRNGQLTLMERLHQVVSRDWAHRRLMRELHALEPSLSELGVLEAGDRPQAEAGFDSGAGFVYERHALAQAAAFLARQRHVSYQRETFLEQIGAEIGSTAAELQTAKAALLDKVGKLPKVVVDSMLEGSWPTDPLEPLLLQELQEAHEQYEAFASQYAGTVDRVDGLFGERASPMYLHQKLQPHRSTFDDTGESEPQRPITPAALGDLLALWKDFSQAVEAEDTLRTTKHDLDRTEVEFEKTWASLPEAIRQNLDPSEIEYSDELVEPVTHALMGLKTVLLEHEAQWKDLHAEAVRVLQQNKLRSRALARAIGQARKNPEYLTDLAGEKIWPSPEILLQDLRVWLLLFQLWSTMANLVDVSRQLKARPRLEEAKAELDRLVEERQSMAGRVLLERWRDVSGGLDLDSMQRVDRYLDAVQALSGDVGSSYRVYKQQAERHFDAALELFPIWSTTNLSTQDLPLKAGLFDIVVVDEASQCDIPSALPLLFRAKRIVIIGDENQLRHIASLPKAIHGPIADRYSIGPRYSYTLRSLFDLAAQSTSGLPGQLRLDEHYRSHKEIIEFSNRHFYGYLKIRTDLSGIPPTFVARGCGVHWIDVRGRAERPGPGQIYNRREEGMITAILRDLVEKLDQLGLDETDIGVVTPFRAQADQVRRSVTALHLPDGRVLVGTVHTYQGDERDLMILSTVATKELPENSFRFMADNPNLLNVAVTRARLSLIVIGDHGFFKGLPGQSYYRKLADYAEELGKVYPSPEELLLLQPLTEEEKPFELGGGIALHKDAPHSNRMTLRRLLASCQGFLWWYDPYMTINALDALALALRGTKGRIRQVRLMTRPDFWENQHGEPACITEEQVTPLKRELEAQGISTQVAVTRYDKENPPPHDRYLFASNLAVNMPPIRNIYQDTAKLAEFLPSSVGAEEFEAWWKQAKVVVE